MKYTRRDAKKYTREHMKGVWAAIPYPFTESGEIDEAALEKRCASLCRRSQD